MEQIFFLLQHCSFVSISGGMGTQLFLRHEDEANGEATTGEDTTIVPS